MSTPWDIASEIPSAHGLASDTFAHLCGGPGGYVLSTPAFFLLAREVYLDEAAMIARRDGEWQFPWEHEYFPRLTNPFYRFLPGACNAYCIGVLAGDMVAAYRALVAIGGPREFICWQDRKNGYRWRRTGPAFDKFLAYVQSQKHRRSPRPDGSPRGFDAGVCAMGSR